MDHSQHAASIFNKYAESYAERFMDVGMYSSSLDLLVANIMTSNATLLDVACGPANISKYLSDRNPKLNIEGIDLSENMIELAKKNIPDGVFSVCDARNILSLNAKYDLIIIGFCFPYLTKDEAIQLIEDASKCLNPEGLLFISTMEDDYANSGPKAGSKGDVIMMHFHEEHYLREALLAHKFSVLKFSVLKVDRVITEMTTGERVVDLCMIGKLWH